MTCIRCGSPDLVGSDYCAPCGAESESESLPKVEASWSYGDGGVLASETPSPSVSRAVAVIERRTLVGQLRAKVWQYAERGDLTDEEQVILRLLRLAAQALDDVDTVGR